MIYLKSVERYISNLLKKYFYNHTGDLAEDESKALSDYILKTSDISLEGLFVECKRSENKFFGFIKCNCMKENLEFEFNIENQSAENQQSAI